MKQLARVNQKTGNHRALKSKLDHSSHKEFYDYYASASQSPATLQRIRSLRDCVLRVVEKSHLQKDAIDVLDIGCGAGTQCIIWAELGHTVHGLDVNEPLLNLGKERSARAGYEIDYRLGSATALPWNDESMDVCLVLELLEHVVEWQRSIAECARVVRLGGILVLTTTNKLCPLQQEFSLPLYSWYPAPMKRYFARLAVTRYRRLANFATYPAVNWFSFYGLRDILRTQGFRCSDRFDVVDLSGKSWIANVLIKAVRRFSVLRWLAHVASRSTLIVAMREKHV